MVMLLVIGLVTCFHQLTGKFIFKEEQYDEWHSYKMTYGYNFTEVEEIDFKRTFYQNLGYINEHNAKNSGFMLAINALAHIKQTLQRRCTVFANENRTAHLNNNSTLNSSQKHYPKSMDWRVNGHVTPVKDQFICGACYTFATVAAIESHISIHHHQKAVSFSEQEIIDCGGNHKTTHCLWGTPSGVFDYVMENGIAVSEEYPYWSIPGRCSKNKTQKRYKIDDYRYIPIGDEEELVRAIAFHGPVVIGINGIPPSFSFYKSGVYKSSFCDPKVLSHVVLAVGYHLGDDPYIIIKNSWGESWGEHGYGKMALFRKNHCGIATYALYPIVTKET